LLGIEHKSFI